MYVDTLVAAAVAGVVPCAPPLAPGADPRSSEPSSVSGEHGEHGGGVVGHANSPICCSGVQAGGCDSVSHSFFCLLHRAPLSTLSA